MWCHQCREDVPALPSSEKPGFHCARCGEMISADTADTNASDAALSYDGWELDEQLRHIDRMLKPLESKKNVDDDLFQRELSRFDLPHEGSSAWHVPRADTMGRQAGRDGKGGAIVASLIWIVLSLGTASFACGGILLGWSLATGRQDLWTLGLPVALGGQIALLVGLVLQLDRLWHDNREAAAKLDNVDEQLHDLKATTTLLGTSQGPAAGVFYAHYAGGAGPRILLSDLKSQIDLLAMKIANDP